MHHSSLDIEYNKFESLYMSLRQKEGRVYSDNEVARLPNIAPDHLLYKEWEIRKRSANRLKTHLGRKNKALQVLEIACGNGWLSAQLAELPDSTITGIDINTREIEQAMRVFHKIKNLKFIHGDIQILESTVNMYDAIILAASIQYFPSVPRLIHALLPLLQIGGEIHILDSPFYEHDQIGDAKTRSNEYYRNAGFPEMSQYYFHHNRLPSHRNPFPWYCIKKKSNK
jgi:ubiquinone/menaquinone biosynthesis C-methylase UbiE